MNVKALFIISSIAVSGSIMAAEYELAVDGLACPFCAYGMEKQLHKVDGVEQVSVDVEAGLIQITTTNGTELTRTQAESAVDEAGFTLRGFNALSQANRQAP